MDRTRFNATEIVAISIPVLIEIVAVCVFIAGAAVWAVIVSGSLPA